MTRYPDIKEKLRAEMDCVVGQDRLPTFADRNNLPYLDAVIAEVFRCSPVVPLLYRMSEAEDVHNGYLVSKHSIVLLNSWCVLRLWQSYRSRTDP
jgi:cytochrome P450